MEEPISKSAKMLSLLESEVAEWNSKIFELITMSKTTSNFGEAQTLMLSYRHMLVDKLIKGRNILSSLNKNITLSRKSIYQNYKTNDTRRWDRHEINDFIESDNADSNYMVGLMKNQIEFYGKTMDTLDKLGFALKNKLDVNNKSY